MSLCKNVLRLHVLRSLYIAALWIRVTISKLDIPDILALSWNEDGSIAWVDDIYLDDTLKILFEENFEETGKNDDEG